MANELKGWERLRHGGLLLDPTRQRLVSSHEPPALSRYHADTLRRLLSSTTSTSTAETSTFVTFVLEIICGFGAGTGAWQRGSQIGAEWTRRAVTGESVKPRQLWTGDHGASLPVFIDDAERIGIGHGRRSTSHVLQWLRGGPERLALLTNGRQWRLIFAGLDFDAWCEWDVELWLEEGDLGAQIDALRVLIGPAQFTPATAGATPPLLQAVLDSRKGQAELSAALGERVREAVELLVQSHSVALAEQCGDVEPSDTYRAAVRVVMRMVVVLFAESRELLPRDNALYHGTYGLSGLLGDLERTGARGGNRLKRQYTAWPRVLALFRLVAEGSHHPALPVPAYGGDLFASAPDEPTAGLDRALRVFETACFDQEVLSDYDALIVLERLTRTRVKVRQGRASTWIQAPVDFSDLSSEYIGILYEGLLDFELRTARDGDPVIFLSVGNQPALPLSRLEAMSDSAIKELLQKMKDTSSGSDDGDAAEDDAENVSEASGDEEEADEADSVDEADSAPGDDEEPETEDARHVTRSRAEQWARRAVAAGKLVRPARGTSSEQRAAHEQQVARKARQLVTRVVLPGERYLVRWGGTRKGSGSFYTRPGLAVPLVQRTLRPLASDPPMDDTGTGILDAPPSQWVPKRPEEILAVTVCDPACGSGTFPIGALRFLTDALYASLHHHGRISTQGDQALVRLLGEAGRGNEEQLGEERLPCRPDDPTFEPRLKAVLRRHVVERCIYGVDLDPLAVELCRLSLWIETMDRTLPFSFIDHKIKCGNGLIGAWFDQFQHYPVMAWKNREGGDKGHSHGVHFEKDARGKALKAWTKDVLTPDLQRFLSGRTLFDADQLTEAGEVHDTALQLLASLHDLPVQDANERGRRYRDLLIGSSAWQRLKSAMDLWCACWFWPVDCLDVAPLPSTLATPAKATLETASTISRTRRFFHWELEFPDVFCEANSGFSAILGNPPWETLQPVSKEYFSGIDPLFRAYGKQEALRKQTDFFQDESLERNWLDYCGDFAAATNHMKYAAIPFGDPMDDSDASSRFAIGRGSLNTSAHERWRAARSKTHGYASQEHPFRHRGEGKAYTYKLFLELGHSLLRHGGRLGFVVPSGIYSDLGTSALRALFLDKCSWEWLFGFENREKLFDIHRSTKFNPIIIQKGGSTSTIRVAFMRRTFLEWEQAETLCTQYARSQIDRFSPGLRAILEVESPADLAILDRIYSCCEPLGSAATDGWSATYLKGDFNVTSDSKLFPPLPKWEEEGYVRDEYNRWIQGPWEPIANLTISEATAMQLTEPKAPEIESWLYTDSAPTTKQQSPRFSVVNGVRLRSGDVQRTAWSQRCSRAPYSSLPFPRSALPEGTILSMSGDQWISRSAIESLALPLYEGRMIGQYEFSQKGWVRGKGRGAEWRLLDAAAGIVEPQYCLGSDVFHANAVGGTKITFMDITSATNARTMIASLVSDQPCGDSAPFIVSEQPWSLLAVLNSFAFDFIARRRCSGLHLSWFVIESASVPARDRIPSRIAQMSLCLSAGFPGFALTWLDASREGIMPVRPWALLRAERVRLRSIIDAVMFRLMGVDLDAARHILRGCDAPLSGDASLLSDTKGLWRVDSELDPELRHTVLTLVALVDLERCVHEAGGSVDDGIRDFLDQNDGDGWHLPERLRLADYSLGHDENALTYRAVASRLGPRFFDWQLTQSTDDFSAEYRLHARNLRAAANPDGTGAGTTPQSSPIVGALRDDPSRDRARESQPSLFD